MANLFNVICEEESYLQRLLADDNLMRGDIEGAFHRIREAHKAEAQPGAKDFWDEFMRKEPYAEGHKVLEAYANHAVMAAVQAGELLPVSEDGKRVFVDGVGDCAIDFDHTLDKS